MGPILTDSNNRNDGVDSHDFVTDSMHMRAGLLTDIPGLRSSVLMPSDDQEGMLKRDNSVEMEELLRGSSMTQDELRAGKKLVHVIVRKSPLTKLDEKEPPKSKSATMTPSIAFRQGEAETISRVVDQVDKTAAKRMQEGFNENNFAGGVLNSFAIAFVLGRWPEHFWLLYIVEMIVFIPIKFVYMIKVSTGSVLYRLVRRSKESLMLVHMSYRQKGQTIE